MYYRCNYLNTQELYEFMLYKSMIACNIRINDGYMYSQKVDFFAPPKWILEIQGSRFKGVIYIYIYIYTWNPNGPCFEWKGPNLLEGSNPKIEDISRFQVYVFTIHTSLNLSSCMEPCGAAGGCNPARVWRVCGRNGSLQGKGSKIPQNSPATTWTTLVTIGTKWDPTSL